MTAILDTSFLFDLTDRSDRNHQRVLAVAQRATEQLVLPTVVLPEICYLIASRLDHAAMRQFIASLTPGIIQVESIIVDDLMRIQQILERYADNHLDFTDAAIVSIAERMTIKRIYTLDQRDFSVIRPKHCEYFELIPD